MREARNRNPSAFSEIFERYHRRVYGFVEDALARLSLDEREVVLLRNHEGMKFREIAETLDITESTAKSRMRYALEKLANMLGFLEEESG